MKAAVILVPSCDTRYSSCKFLAVPRRNSPKYGLPGGKVDDNETLLEAAIRECFEETGVKILDAIQLYEATDIDGFITTAFLARSYVLPKTLSGDVGTPEFVSSDTLTSIHSGAFPEYNSKVFDQFYSLKLSDNFYYFS